MKLVPAEDYIAADDFLQAAIKNSYWKKAGNLVVKELIFLDCLYSYYQEKRSMLSDDDYNVLKDSLTWEGSAAVILHTLYSI